MKIKELYLQKYEEADILIIIMLFQIQKFSSMTYTKIFIYHIMEKL